MKRIKRFFKWLYGLDWDAGQGTASYVTIFIVSLIIICIYPYIIGAIWGIFIALIVCGLLLAGVSLL